MKFEEVLQALREGKKIRPNKNIPWYFINQYGELRQEKRHATRSIIIEWIISSEEWEIYE